jgi:hypothetical protein
MNAAYIGPEKQLGRKPWLHGINQGVELNRCTNFFDIAATDLDSGLLRTGSDTQFEICCDCAERFGTCTTRAPTRGRIVDLTWARR